jgi:nucleotide-binding universal stress UspA family protein
MIRHLLVHVGSTGNSEAAVDVALRLGRKLGAHVSALYTIRRVMMMATFFGDRSPAVEDAARHEHARAEAMEAAFRERARAAEVAAAWHVGEGDAAALVDRAGRLHDLIVVAQDDPGTPEIGFDVTEHAVYRSGCPTLIVPRGNPVTGVADHAAVLWDGRRETTLALRGALPILAAASRVTVLAVPEAGSPDIFRPVRLSVLTYLSGHGIRADIVRVEPPASRPFGVLLDRAIGLGADLFVTGAPPCDSVPLRLVRPEPTRTLLRHARIPILLAH